MILIKEKTDLPCCFYFTNETTPNSFPVIDDSGSVWLDNYTRMFEYCEGINPDFHKWNVSNPNDAELKTYHTIIKLNKL